MAMSALPSSDSVPAAALENATPMLAATLTSTAFKANGWPSVSMSEAATLSHFRGTRHPLEENREFIAAQAGDGIR